MGWLCFSVWQSVGDCCGIIGLNPVYDGSGVAGVLDCSGGERVLRQFGEIVNDMLISVYHKILRVEEEFLQKALGDGLTIREMHMIEFIGGGASEGRALSDIAVFLGVARPSVTVSAKKLEQKGLITKHECARDRRIVLVKLTRAGRKIYLGHMRFHMLMVKELESGFDDEEKSVLVRAIGKLDSFFQKSIEGIRD